MTVEPKDPDSQSDFGLRSKLSALHIYRKLGVSVILAPTLLLCSAPLLRSASFFRTYFGPSLLRSWDGAAHLAADYLYARTIFPDTFGWTDVWSAGMPLPNFYPPLFYWITALLDRAGVPILLAFKLTVAIPFILTPVALGLLTWRLTSRDLLATSCATLAACFPLLDPHFQGNFPGGLTYVSTFNEGLCTQPLGFLLLVIWLSMYLRPISSWVRFVLASVTLALVVLASFFSTVAAVPFVMAGLMYDLREHNCRVAADVPRVRIPLKGLALSFAALLCAFWTVPVLAEYPYFVTRPLETPLSEAIPPGLWLWIWFCAAVAGGTLMAIKPSSRGRAFMVGCLGLAPLTLPAFSRIPWMPSQPVRLFSTLVFLLAVPVGRLLAALIRLLIKLPWKRQRSENLRVATITFLVIVAAIAAIKPAPLGEALYIGEAPFAKVLDFARIHRDGRYIVENAWQHSDQHDSRALNAYLGMQGNETAAIVFHEASPSSVFFTPLVNALSASVDSFGISATLANDLDFYNQSPERHLRSAAEVGVRYIACMTPWLRRRFRQQANLIEHDLGRWSVFELRDAVATEVETLRYLPALVVSSTDFKERKSGSYSFVRLSEEQFNSGYSNVLLAQAQTDKIDELSNLEGFGALILETYDYSNEDVAFKVIRRFAQQHLVVLIDSERHLYCRLTRHLTELPHAVIIRRETESQSQWLSRSAPWLELDQSTIRKLWNQVHAEIENNKIAIPLQSGQSSISRGDRSIHVEVEETQGIDVPIIIRTTFHPDWVRSDGQQIYPVSPFFMLTFAKAPFTVTFHRSLLEKAAVGVSVGTLLLLFLTILLPIRRVPSL